MRSYVQNEYCLLLVLRTVLWVLNMNVDMRSNMTQMMLETLYDAVFDLVIVVSVVNYCNLNNVI